jgi:hypothetical protein
MSKPLINQIVGGYKFVWMEEKVEIIVNRIRETKVSTTAELNIDCTAPGRDHPHVKQTTLSLSSSAPREKLAKELKSAVPGIEWVIILEQLCVKALEEIRRGEPVVILGSDNEVSPPEYLIEPFIIRNQPNVIFGEPGSAKTTFALILASILTISWIDNPGKLLCPVKPCRVLWLDWETDRAVINWQLSCIQRGHGFELPYEIFYRRCSIPLADDLEQIKASLDEYHADVTFFDSLGLACGGDLNSAEPALRFFSAYRQLNTTGVLLAHTARNTEQSNRHIFGSMFFEAQARNIWEIVKSQDDEDSIVIGLYHKKPPPFGKLRKPLGYKFSFDEGSKETYFEYHDPKSVSELLDRMNTNTRILEFLKSGAKTPKEIQTELGIGESTCRVTIKRLKDKNLLTKIGDSYGLLSKFYEPLQGV